MVISLTYILTKNSPEKNPLKKSNSNSNLLNSTKSIKILLFKSIKKDEKPFLT